MPIILAIEPDKRQAAHVSAIVRHRVGAELILADTTEGALDAIGSRVPDVVLVPALLSPQDDAALAAALRVIAAAAHVRTLTIPVFANGVSHEERGGLLSRWRRGRTETIAGGCDPAVFAEQILAYLREAATERADAEPEMPIAASAPAAAPPPPPKAAEPALADFETYTPAPVEQIAASAIDEAPPAFERFAQAPAFETPAAFEASAVADRPIDDDLQFAREADAEPFEFMYATEAASPAYTAETTSHAATPAGADEPDDEVVIDLSEDIEEISPETPAEELFDGEPMGVYTISSFDEALHELEAEPAPRAAKPFEPFEARPAARAASFDPPSIDAPMPAIAPAARVERRVFDQPLAAASIEHERPAKVEPREPAWITSGLRHSRIWPTLEGVAVESPGSLVGLEEFSEALTTPAAATARPSTAPAVPATPSRPAAAPPAPPRAAAAAPAPKSDHVEWAELVASLRQDIERRRNQPSGAAASAATAAKHAVAAKPATPAQADEVEPPVHATVAAPARRRRASAPVQDEWGLFDPEQCGFAALLAKLDEFSDTGDETDARQAS
jgi:hypothetical protein